MQTDWTTPYNKEHEEKINKSKEAIHNKLSEMNARFSNFNARISIGRSSTINPGSLRISIEPIRKNLSLINSPKPISIDYEFEIPEIKLDKLG